MAAGRESYVVRVGDEHIGRTVYRTGEYEFHKFTRALDVLGVDSVRTLLDVGANIGTVCIPAVARGHAARAIAIEPEPVNVALLAANVRLNGLQSSVTCVHAAAGAADGQTLELELAATNFGDHRVASLGAPRSDRRATVSVPSVTLDDLAPTTTGTQDLIWMDVQGYELQVLRGASRLMTQGVPVVMEFWPAALAEHNSATEIREVLGSWSTIVDLGSRSLDPLDSAGIDRLLSALSRDGTQTDLLVRR
jgi:FkbM family methyltransferase